MADALRDLLKEMREADSLCARYADALEAALAQQAEPRCKHRDGSERVQDNVQAYAQWLHDWKENYARQYGKNPTTRPGGLTIWNAARRVAQERTCEHGDLQAHDIREQDDLGPMVTTGWCEGPAQENDHE